MKTARARMIFDCLRRAVLPSGAGLTDGQLLREYFAHKDETAFAALVRRHGPMVLAVCRRVLGRAEDAEDAFQAAFVVLARKGLRIAERQTIGGWLHGVAYHVALDARRRDARRRGKEQQVEIMPQPIVIPGEDLSELLAVLDRELNCLPDKYRVPVVLCELEGHSRKEAARQLGLPEGTLSSRLATARKMLAKRMAAQGPAVTGASLTVLFASEAGAAVVTGPLVSSTVRAAGGVVSVGVVALAEGVLKAMLLTKIKSAAIVLLLAVGVGTVTLTYRTMAAEPQPKIETPPVARAASPDKDDLKALRLEVAALRKRVVALEAKEQARKTAEPNEATNGKTLHLNATTLQPETNGIPIELGFAPAQPGTNGVNVRFAAVRFDPNAETKSAPTNLQAIQEAAAILQSNPTSKPAQELLKRALEQSNSLETKVKKAAAFLRKCPENEEAQNGLKEALEQLNRSTKPKSEAPKQ